MSDTPPPSSSYPRTLLALYTEPTSAFTALLARPRVWEALLLAMCASLAFMAIWSSRADFYEVFRNQLEAQGRAVPPREQVPLDFVRNLSWLMAVCAPAIMIVVGAGLMALLFNFVLGDELRFVHALSVVAHVHLAIAAVVMPLMLTVIALKGDWSLPPEMALQSNLGALLDRGSTPATVFALASSCDLFSLWSFVLLSIGLGVAVRRGTAHAARPLGVIWALFVALKVGWAAL